MRLPGGGEHRRPAPPPGTACAEGDTALVSARPEHIGLSRPPTTAARCRGRVTDVEFTGMATHLTVDVARQGGEVRAAIDVPAGVDVGDQVGLRLYRERLWVVRP